MGDEDYKRAEKVLQRLIAEKHKDLESILSLGRSSAFVGCSNMPRSLNTVRPRKPVDAVEVYRLTDNPSGKPRCHFRSDIAAELVEQDLARWCKNGYSCTAD